jgi:hypothetical protein
MKLSRRVFVPLLLLCVNCSRRAELEPQRPIEVSPNSPLALRITTDKKSYRIGDNIAIMCLFSNASMKGVTFLPWFPPYPAEWFDLADKSSVRPGIIHLGISDPLHPPPIKLEPGQTHIFVIEAKIARASLSSVGGKDVRGIFIEFEDSAFLLERLGEFRIRVKFDNSRFKNSIAKSSDETPAFWGGIVSGWESFTVE